VIPCQQSGENASFERKRASFVDEDFCLLHLSWVRLDKVSCVTGTTAAITRPGTNTSFRPDRCLRGCKTRSTLRICQFQLVFWTIVSHHVFTGFDLLRPISLHPMKIGRTLNFGELNSVSDLSPVGGHCGDINGFPAVGKSRDLKCLAPSRKTALCDD
jgi:hypothetical protein